MGIKKLKQKFRTMSYKENTRKNTERFNLKETTQKRYRIAKRAAQSEEAYAAMQIQHQEDHDRSMSRKRLGKKVRNNGKLNKAQRNCDKVEDVIDVEKMNIALKETSKSFSWEDKQDYLGL